MRRSPSEPTGTPLFFSGVPAPRIFRWTGFGRSFDVSPPAGPSRPLPFGVVMLLAVVMSLPLWGLIWLLIDWLT